MDNLESWKVFESTGKVQDYLKFTNQRRINEARESFVSNVEGVNLNGRKSNSDRNGHFINEYKGIR